jgi:glycosyltransferase involved in cell wall biosynthesis
VVDSNLHVDASPLRIAHLLSSFGMGGQERVALDLAVAQKALGHEVIAISLAHEPEGPLAVDFRANGIVAETIPKTAAGFDAALPLKLAARFRKERIAIVHTHNPQPLIYGALAAKLAGARAVHTKHGANPGGGRRFVLRRAAARLCDAFVAVSRETEEIARTNHEVAEEKLITIPNGIQLARFHPDPAARAEVRRELSIPEGAWLVGTVGRLWPEKDQALLLRAAARTLGPDRQVALVGSGIEEARLRAQVAELGDRARYVHFLGLRRDVPRVLAALDVFALTSVTEGLPLVIPEAMATGLPVVATAVGGIPSVLDEGMTGLLVPKSDAEKLEAAFERLAGDRELARAMGARARDVALRRYEAKRMAASYVHVYRRVLTRR